MTYRADVLALTPTVYMPMDDASGATCLDVSGNGYNGTLHGTYQRGIPCPVGSRTFGTFFDGVSGYLQNGARFTTQSKLTLVCWLFVTTYDATQRWLYTIGDPNAVGPSPFWRADQVGGTQACGISKGDGVNYQERRFARAPDSAWSMFAATFDTNAAVANDEVKVYMQGNLTTVTVITNPAIGGNWQNADGYFMRQGINNALYLQGSLADVAIWSGTLLTLPQLSALNRSGGGFGAGTATLSGQALGQASLDAILADLDSLLHRTFPAP